MHYALMYRSKFVYKLYGVMCTTIYDMFVLFTLHSNVVVII